MTAWLCIGEEQTTVRLDEGDAGPHDVVLALGTLSVARNHFRHEPPTADELESAIESIEDVLMPAIPRLRGPAPLLTRDDESRALLAAAGLPRDLATQLDVAAVERLFARLARVGSGYPAASEGLPERRSFAANLLILRELMHHAGRSTLTIVPATAQQDPL